MIETLRVTVAVLLYCAVSSLFARASWSTELRLQGPITQGSLVRGALPAGAEVFFDNQSLVTSAKGEFVIGFARDDTAAHELRWRLPNGESDYLMLTPQRREYDIQRIDGLAPKMVSPPDDVKARIADDNKKVARARSAVSPYNDVFGSFISPAQGRISGVYGSQRILNGEPRQPHFGLDIAAPVGTPVVAPAAGIVTLASDLYYSGNTLIIDHGMGVFSTFLHLDRFTVDVGDRVEQGQQIATIGATGRVTGAHLDWRINLGAMRLDPALLVPQLSSASRQ